MKLNTFTFTEIDQHDNARAFLGFLHLRKQAFVDGAGWALSNDGFHEMDQYDTPQARYSVVSDNGEVIAGARVLPSSANWGGNTYMLLDGQLGRLPFIPAGLLYSYPRDYADWECTRLAICDGLDNLTRTIALKAVVAGLCTTASAGGATRLFSLSPVVFGRLLRQIGYDCSPAGPSYRNTEDGKSYRAFSMPCDPSINGDLLSLAEMWRSGEQHLMPA